jgi:molybdopterin/thiamine biosynthesis adenylyltransferase
LRLLRVKAEHRPHTYDDSGRRGAAGETGAPDGHAGAALWAMDGTRTPAEIVARLRRLFPRLSDEDAQEIVDLLGAPEHIAGARPPAELSPSELDRYSRNAAFFRRTGLTGGSRSWEAQVRLKRSRVLVLGLGGTGSHTAWALAACGIGEIHCVDRDVVEPSDLTGQALYREADVGRPKVDVAVARLGELNSSSRITGESRAVDGEQDMAGLVRGFDALAMCAEEPGGRGGLRIWANRVCLAEKIPWALGGCDGAFAGVAAFDPQGPCYECLTAGVDASLAPGITVDFGEPGVIAPSAGVSGHLTAQAVISFLTGIPESPGSYVTGVDLIAPDRHVYTRHPAVPGCPACAGSGSPSQAAEAPAAPAAPAAAATG